MKEEWKSIKWWEWIYQISTLWRVKSFKYWKIKFLKPSLKNNWYYRVSLSGKDKMYYSNIHRLVWLHFIENPENKPEINHIDWDKSNNTLSNLEWNTYKENINHSTKILWNSYKWKIINQYTLEWEFIKTWDNAISVHRELWILNNWISLCCRWIHNQCWWYKWRFS